MLFPTVLQSGQLSPAGHSRLQERLTDIAHALPHTYDRPVKYLHWVTLVWTSSIELMDLEMADGPCDSACDSAFFAPSWHVQMQHHVRALEHAVDFAGAVQSWSRCIFMEARQHDKYIHTRAT